MRETSRDKKGGGMVKKMFLGVVLVLFSIGIAHAEEKFLQLSLFDPYQIVPADQSISGIRLGAFYTVNNNVSGFSLTFLGVNRATGNVQGVEWGLGNWVEGSFHGWQSGWVNYAGSRFVGLQSGLVDIAKSDFTGVQWGMINWAEGFLHGVQAGFVNISKSEFVGAALGAVNYNDGAFKGFQWGFFNYAAKMEGFQLGFVNWTKSLNGLQIGLGNYNGNKQPFEFLPIVNWSF